MSKIGSIFLGQERKHGAGRGGGRGQLLSPPTLSMLMDVVRLGLFDNILTILQHYTDTNYSGLGC